MSGHHTFTVLALPVPVWAALWNFQLMLSPNWQGPVARDRCHGLQYAPAVLVNPSPYFDGYLEVQCRRRSRHFTFLSVGFGALRARSSVPWRSRTPFSGELDCPALVTASITNSIATSEQYSFTYPTNEPIPSSISGTAFGDTAFLSGHFSHALVSSRISATTARARLT